MIYPSTQSNDYLWYPILRGKKTKTRPNAKFLPIFNGRNKNMRCFDFNSDLFVSYVNSYVEHVSEIGFFF